MVHKQNVFWVAFDFLVMSLLQVQLFRTLCQTIFDHEVFQVNPEVA